LYQRTDISPLYSVTVQFLPVLYTHPDITDSHCSISRTENIQLRSLREGYGGFPLVHAATWKHTAFINHSQLCCALRGFLDKSEFGNTSVLGSVQPSSSPLCTFSVAKPSLDTPHRIF
jgi:hypothetical protein